MNVAMSLGVAISPLSFSGGINARYLLGASIGSWPVLLSYSDSNRSGVSFRGTMKGGYLLGIP